VEIFIAGKKGGEGFAELAHSLSFSRKGRGRKKKKKEEEV